MAFTCEKDDVDVPIRGGGMIAVGDGVVTQFPGSPCRFLYPGHIVASIYSVAYVVYDAHCSIGGCVQHALRYGWVYWCYCVFYTDCSGIFGHVVSLLRPSVYHKYQVLRPLRYCGYIGSVGQACIVLGACLFVWSVCGEGACLVLL